MQEITQLDVEMSFPDREVLFALMEEMFAAIWRECLDVEIETPWPRMTFAEADRRFGSDKPDTRFGLELEDATELTRGSEFGVFAGAEAVRFLRVPRTYSRAELAALEELAKERGAKGLAYIVRDEQRRAPLADREVPLGARSSTRSRPRPARRCSSRPTRGRRPRGSSATCGSTSGASSA